MCVCTCTTDLGFTHSEREDAHTRCMRLLLLHIDLCVCVHICKSGLYDLGYISGCDTCEVDEDF